MEVIFLSGTGGSSLQVYTGRCRGQGVRGHLNRQTEARKRSGVLQGYGAFLKRHNHCGTVSRGTERHMHALGTKVPS